MTVLAVTVAPAKPVTTASGTSKPSWKPNTNSRTRRQTRETTAFAQDVTPELLAVVTLRVRWT